jgi:hypothetical protein
MKRKIVAIFAWLTVVLASMQGMAQTTAPPKDASSTVQWEPLDPTLLHVIIVIVLVAIFIAFALIFRRLAEPTSKWSLAEALSEEADVTVNDANGMPYTVGGTVVKKTELAASTSRLIAFIGTIAILFLFIGFGVILIFEYGRTGKVDNAEAVGKYLLAGLTLFAPYVVNKFSSVFAPK